MKNKKIFAIFTFLFLSSMVFALSYDINSNDTLVIYGKNAATSDASLANDISKFIVATATTIKLVIGNESALIQSHGNDLNFNDTLSSVITSKFTYKDLPGILASGSVEYDDGSEEDYTQELTFGDISIDFNSLEEEDYVVNEKFSSNQIPLIYLDLKDYLWNLEIDFDDPLDATDLEDGATIKIAGKDYTFKPNMDKDDDLVLFASSQKYILILNEKKTFDVNGEIITIELIGANDENDKAYFKIDNDLESAKEGDIIATKGQKIYVNNVFIRTIPSYEVTVELFVGADEILMDVNDGSFDTIEVNGKSLDGIEARITTVNGTIDEIKTIDFRFFPTDVDDVEDEVQFLEVGEGITDPLFRTISMVFDSLTTPLDSEDRDFIEIEAQGDELEITFTNVDENEIEFIPYEIISGNLESKLVNGSIGYDEEIFITQVSTEITEVFRIKDIDADEVEIYSYTEGKSKDYEVNDTLENTNIVITAISGTNVTFDDISSNVLYSENKMKIHLFENSIEFDEAYMDFDEWDMNNKKTIVTVNLTADGNNIEIGSIYGSYITQETDEDGDIEYTLTNGYATYFVNDVDDKDSLKIYVPEEETDFNIYISDVVEEVEETEGISLVAKDDTDKESKNVIIVGGSCVNIEAAKLLNSDAPLCAEDFTEATGVTDGQYLYQVFENPENEDGIAILIAGYNAEDTTRGVKEFLEGSFSLTVGTKEIN